MEIKRDICNKRMSGIVEYNGTIYFSGLTYRAEGIVAQTKGILEKIDNRLALAGSDKKHLLRATIFLKNMSDFDAMNEVWEAWTVEDCAPARACVRADMASSDILIEISFIAAVK